MKMSRRARKPVVAVVEKPAPQPSQMRRAALLATVLAAATFLAYYPVLLCGFVSDDDLYVTQNAGVQAGLSPNAVAWALCEPVAANWHPLTVMSLQLDYELFGLKAWGYHLHNLLLHVANVVLLFHVLRRLTGAVWRSFVVAALFALHPLHVESVAWVSERKDVLSTFFGLLALWAYLWYASRPGLGRMTTVAVLLTLSLLAKPMWVTCPCLLLLLDFWPLGRWGNGWKWQLLAEKTPLLAIAVLFSMATVNAQRVALSSFQNLPLAMRTANAADSYVAYLRQTFVPANLAIYYPHPREGSRGWPAALLLLAVSAAAVKFARRLPYLFVGWFWYLGMLVPVIGLVQVGAQARADRYTYVPLIGVFVALTWGVGELLARVGWQRLGFAAAVLLAVLCGVLTWFQIDHWRRRSRALAADTAGGAGQCSGTRQSRGCASGA